MGVPARKMEANPFVHRSAHLALVATPPAPAPARTRAVAKKATTRTAPKKAAVAAPHESASTRARVRKEEASARAAFGFFVVALVCAFVLGGARVALIVRAAEASVVEGRVQADIKAQRAEADKLEVDRSSLSTPSRIAGIASASMNMGEPRSVRYISLPADGTAAATGAAAGAGTVVSAIASNDVVGRLFGAVMDLSAGEAQSLLVGDLGLAGSH
jgi:cell division protein FtsL